MNALIVDTSGWMQYFKGQPFQGVDDALQNGHVYLPPMIIAELLSGKLAPPKKVALIDFLAELPLISIDFNHWVRVGELRRKSAAKGLSLSTPDAHIAQCCIDIGARLVSEDQVFRKLAKLIPDFFI